jgi:putative tryptophan/tyrosine transport system permease protein
MTLLIGALTIGAILSLLALGVFVSFRVFDFPDITADGSITLGAALTAALIVRQADPVLATIAGCGCGAFAGILTGLIHTRFGINKLLSGILTMTALYSVNLHIMGRSNVPLLSEVSLATMAEGLGNVLFRRSSMNILGWEVAARDLSMLICAGAVAVLVCTALYVFFRTNLGTAMQAAGENPQMIRALGVNVENMIVLGLMLSNALVALAGALLAQYQGFADVQMGIGMVVWGLASVIIGEALVGTRQIGFVIAGAVMGSVLFRLLVALALRGGLDPNDLKLVTAVFVFLALIAPKLAARVTGPSRTQGTKAGAPRSDGRVHA